MHALKEHRSPTKALPDLLNWAAVIDDGIVLNKDGSLMAGFFYRGQDLATVTAAERNRVSAVVNAALSKLGSEWMLHQDAVRVEARAYPAPEESAFPDPITALIDQERRYQFGREGSHYESIYAIVVTYLPAKLTQSKVADMMFEETGNANKKGRSGAGDRALRQFKSALLEIEDRLSSVLDLNRMQGIPYVDEDGREHINDQLLQFLHYSLTGNPHPINLPPCPMYLDAVIGGHEFWSGIVPRLDDKLIQVVAIDGFPQESYPASWPRLTRCRFNIAGTLGLSSKIPWTLKRASVLIAGSGSRKSGAFGIKFFTRSRPPRAALTRTPRKWSLRRKAPWLRPPAGW